MLDALFAAVRERPDDDHARLVLADALQEAGDPRGALINLQVQLALVRVDPESPDWQARKTAERELIAAHLAEWKPAGLVGVQVEFRRGFVEKLTGATGVLRELAGTLLAAFPLVHALELNDTRPSTHDLESLLDTPLARPVNELVLSADDAVAKTIGRLTHLVTLKLNAHDLSAQGVAQLAEAVRLSSLAIVGDAPGRARVELGVEGTRQLARLRALRKLQLIDTDIADEGAAVLANAELPTLESLALEGCELGPAGAKALGAATSFQKLAALDLRGNRLGKAGVRALLKGDGLTALRELGLRDCALKDAGVQALADSGRVLERLDLRDNGLTDATVGLLAAAPGLESLRVLNVNRNHLTHAGQESLRVAFPSTAVYSAHQTRK